MSPAPIPVRQREIIASPARWLEPLLLFVIAVVATAAFSPGLRGEFLNWDDDRNFLDNPGFKGPWPDVIRWAWSTYHLGVWQPAAWLLVAVEYRASGMQPFGYHVTSLVLHIFNTGLLYALLVRLTQRFTKKAGPSDVDIRWTCGAAAALFAVHPLRCEAVCWVSCQPYLPAAFFYLLALVIYVGPARSSPSFVRQLLVLGCYGIAISFKAVAISLPIVLLLLDIFLPDRLEDRDRWARRLGRILFEKLPYIVIAAAVGAWAVAAKDYSESRMPFREFDPNVRFSQAAAAVWFYLVKTIWPSQLTAYYRLPENLALSNWRYAAAAAGLVAITITLFLHRRRWPAAALCWPWYLLVLLPNLGLVQIGQQLAADRYSYLASIPLACLLVSGMLWMFRDARRWTGIASLTLACTLFAVVSRNYSRSWNDSESLWSANLAVDADCSVAHCNLGEALARKARYADASSHLSKAIDLDSQLAFAYANLGVILCKARRFEDAAAFGEKAIEIKPGLHGKDLARAHAMLGEAYAGLRRDDLAWKHTKIARDLGLEEAEKMIDYLRTISREP